MDLLILYLLIGIAYGFGPCLMFCLPMVLGLVVMHEQDTAQGIVTSAIFSIGRVTSHMVLGTLTALLGLIIFANVPSIVGLNIATSVLYLSIGSYLIWKSLSHSSQSSRTHCFLSKLRRIGVYRRSKRRIMALLAGIYIGFIPCPPLIAVLGDVLVAYSLTLAMEKIFLFGVGTCIGTVILGFLGGKTVGLCKSRNFMGKLNALTGAFIIGMGLLRL